MVTPSGKLHIHNTNEYDGKMSYWCQVQHRLSHETFLSTTSGRIYLTTPQGGVSPKIIDYEANIRVESRQRGVVDLPCAAQGNPAPFYRYESQHS